MRAVPALPDRVAVLLGEIETVRQICALCEPAELTGELNSFISALARHAQSSLPALGDYQIHERSIHFRPAKSWKVLPGRAALFKDDSVTVVVDLQDIVGLEAYWSDAYVGIHVPEKWRRAPAFASLAGKLKLDGFEALVNVESPEEHDDWTPVWRDISYARFAKAGIFDTRGFVGEVTRILRSLSAATKRIEALIQYAKQQHAGPRSKA
jgi:hypothetical protein